MTTGLGRHQEHAELSSERQAETAEGTQLQPALATCWSKLAFRRDACVSRQSMFARSLRSVSPVSRSGGGTQRRPRCMHPRTLPSVAPSTAHPRVTPSAAPAVAPSVVPSALPSVIPANASAPVVARVNPSAVSLSTCYVPSLLPDVVRGTLPSADHSTVSSAAPKCVSRQPLWQWHPAPSSVSSVSSVSPVHASYNVPTSGRQHGAHRCAGHR